MSNKVDINFVLTECTKIYEGYIKNGRIGVDNKVHVNNGIYYCNGTSVKINENITKIGSAAFTDCDALETVRLFS